MIGRDYIQATTGSSQTYEYRASMMPLGTAFFTSLTYWDKSYIRGSHMDTYDLDGDEANAKIAETVDILRTRHSMNTKLPSEPPYPYILDVANIFYEKCVGGWRTVKKGVYGPPISWATLHTRGPFRMAGNERIFYEVNRYSA